MEKKQSHQELIYNYPLYSIKRFPILIRYCKPTAKAIANKIGGRKSWLSILADMIWCDIRYGAMDSRDYLLFEFLNLSIRKHSCVWATRHFSTENMPILFTVIGCWPIPKQINI